VVRLTFQPARCGYTLRVTSKRNFTCFIQEESPGAATTIYMYNIYIQYIYIYMF
jgi:hypothetical protein